MRFLRFLALATLVGTVAGCDTIIGLEVPNENNPDRPRVLANPADVEGLASGQFQQIVVATLGAGPNTTQALQRLVQPLQTMAFENASGLNNNGMGPRSNLPRGPIDNSRGNQFDIENFSAFRILSGVARNSADILARGKEPTFSLGDGLETQRDRMIGWTHFVSGVAHGYLAMTYDSAAIASPADAAADIPPLLGYDEVMTYALAQFDSALVYLARPGVPAIPQGWLTGPGGTAVSVADFTRVVRSFRARMRAGVARTPAERAAVDWAAVIADAEAGIQSDLVVGMNRGQQWDFHWLHSSYHYRDVAWHQMPYHIIGMADVSSAFDRWLGQPRDEKEPFLIITPDLRFPQGATRAAQNQDRGGQGIPSGRKYFRNRLEGLDATDNNWRISQYDHYRFRAFADAAGVAPHPIFTRAENDMLAAEGHIRRNNFAAAAALIDRTRTTSGLPSVAGATMAMGSIPGGANCVPRIPVGPSFTSSQCGNILEAMKWEKRLESAYTTFGAWYFDSRGWGDLPVGTPIHWPVPIQELDARRLPAYNTGGVDTAGNPLPGGAGPSTYGYGSGQR
jgi:hypothetical protein